MAYSHSIPSPRTSMLHAEFQPSASSFRQSVRSSSGSQRSTNPFFPFIETRKEVLNEEKKEARKARRVQANTTIRDLLRGERLAKENHRGIHSGCASLNDCATVFVPLADAQKPVHWQPARNSTWEARQDPFADEKKTQCVAHSHVEVTTPIRKRCSAVDVAPLNQPLAKTKPASPQRTSTTGLYALNDAQSGLRTSPNVKSAAKSLVSTRRASNGFQGNGASRKSHSVAIVRLMAPIEPAPLSKSTLYTPFPVSVWAVSRSPAAKASSLKTKSVTSIEESPQIDIETTSADTVKVVKSHGKVASGNDNFNLSPEATPRKSLPPQASHEPTTPVRREPPRVHESVMKPVKKKHGAGNEAVHETSTSVASHPTIGHKAASVADLRKFFDRPGPSNMSTHSMPKLSPAKQCEGNSFRPPRVSKTMICAGTTKSPSLSELTKTSNHSPGPEKTDAVRPRLMGGPSAQSRPVQENQIGALSRSRLRAFLHSNRSSGSWRRLSSHLRRRGSHEQSSSTGDATCPSQAFAGSASHEATRSPSARNSTTENKYPASAGSGNRNGGQLLAKLEPLAPLTTTQNALNGSKRSWVWGHVHRAKEQSGAAFHASEAAASVEENKLFRRVSKESRFRSWSWGRRSGTKASLNDAKSNSVNVSSSTRDTQGSSTSTFNGPFEDLEHSETDAAVLSNTDMTSVTASSPMVDAEASCELQHPIPVHVDDIQRLVSLCKKREKSPSLSYLFQP
ncbi:uncharacterized protein SPSK_08643 [Sporothrix schenckii 1099-18]|uniref:Uncharacterized protein n=1 Tax=Sporothrix schenckii 1099-18 TaxID=1397361 RepID=A0A0F2M7C9_SPOSC|nr:uncharacterized protein SPSK_08643 [Sporothrix schenckii 1099-18]KJR84740.1 hypothetical protein SPSK_08643 [Sporothrix schenckii 1099-18]